MSKELLITLPKRGLRVIPPAETRQNMTRARTGEKVSWSAAEKARLLMLRDCNILAKRYPKREDGKRFMEEVNYEWREELFEMSKELSSEIVLSWNRIAPEKDIAVVLFGSVAKGLVKEPHSINPSNIDMAVIGRISQTEKEALFDMIRPKRKAIQQRILSRCPYIDFDSEDPNPGNAGVIIQDVSKLKKNGYEPTIRYIASGAFAMHDPANIWSEIERQAIAAWSLHRTSGSAGNRRT
jgi:predicted nucleotidyltransferase